MEEQITALMKIKAEILMMQKKLVKANNRVSQHYEVEPAYELGTVAETGQLDSRNGGHAGDPIQVIKQVTIKSQVNEFHEPGAATGGATGSSTALISTYRTESTTSQSKYPSKAKRPSQQP